jgi:AcrR family transcriptional regulator
MKVQKNKKEIDSTTEAKILEAARVLFYKKGFAATRTRDITTEAGINLALLNYYFGSKEKLFNTIMLETMQQFAKAMGGVLNDTTTTFENKLELLAANYIDLLSGQPELPIFILSEIRSNPQVLISKIKIKEVLQKSVFILQFKEQIRNRKINKVHPIHFVMNFLGMLVFPFIASPMLKRIGDLKEDEFDKIMQERKALIPFWVQSMLNQS